LSVRSNSQTHIGEKPAHAYPVRLSAGGPSKFRCRPSPIQQALFAAAVSVTDEPPQLLKRRLATGSVITTDDRNWELRYTRSTLRFNQSRAVAIDMASAKTEQF